MKSRAKAHQGKLNHTKHGEVGRPKAVAPTMLLIFSLALALDFIMGFRVYPSGFPPLISYTRFKSNLCPPDTMTSGLGSGKKKAANANAPGFEVHCNRDQHLGPYKQAPPLPTGERLFFGTYAPSLLRPFERPLKGPLRAVGILKAFSKPLKKL